MLKRGFRNKKAQEQLHAVLIQLIIFLAVIAILVLYISGIATGKLIKEQVGAKQTALLLDGAQPGTTITLQTELSITKKDSLIKATLDKTFYSYDFFSPFDIEIIQQENKILLKIGR